MIKTKDRRKFFTHEKNYLPLIEFSKVFNAEISIIKAKDAEVLDLDELAPAICDANYIQPQPEEYDILKVVSKKKRNRRNK
jgi:hypothetical protein